MLVNHLLALILTLIFVFIISINLQILERLWNNVKYITLIISIVYKSTMTISTFSWNFQSRKLIRRHPLAWHNDVIKATREDRTIERAITLVSTAISKVAAILIINRSILSLPSKTLIHFRSFTWYLLLIRFAFKELIFCIILISNIIRVARFQKVFYLEEKKKKFILQMLREKKRRDMIDILSINTINTHYNFYLLVEFLFITRHVIKI